MKKIFFSFTFLCLILKLAPAQNPDNLAVVFSLDDLFQMIETYHPSVLKAELKVRMGNARLLAGKGGFDPQLFAQIDQKEFENKKYFRHLDGGINFPTPYGIEFKSGLEQHNGIFLNPENSTPPGGLLYAGIKLPLGRGLFIDERRANLFSAKIRLNAAEAEKQMILNDLFYYASLSYWNWVNAFFVRDVFQRSFSLASERLEFVKGSFNAGSLAAIDTLEAFLQKQMLSQQLMAAELTLLNTRLSLSNYLWDESNVPLLLSENATPPPPLNLWENLSELPDNLQNFLSSQADLHPELRFLSYELEALNVDRRLKADRLKPRIDLQYNILTEPVGSDLVENISPQNYKWGANFAFPLFLRKERADLQIAKIRIEDTQLSRENRLPQLRNQLLSFLNEIENLSSQTTMLEDGVNISNRLLEAERIRLSNGESSLFMINTRQLSLIQAELKLLDNRIKRKKAAAGFQWSLGTAQNIQG
jgi:outer membrane protein TolC